MSGKVPMLHIPLPTDRVEESFGMTYRARCTCGWRDTEYRREITTTRAYFEEHMDMMAEGGDA